MKRFNFKSAIVAGFVATVVMTIFMAFFDMNITKLLGMAMGKTGSMAYIIGGLIHLGVGLFYGLIFALIVQPILNKLPGFLSGSLYGIAIGVIALIFTPMFMGKLHKWGGQCHPMGTAKVYAQYGYQGCYPQDPEHPCYPQHPNGDQDQQQKQYPFDHDEDETEDDEESDNDQAPNQPNPPQYPEQDDYGSSPYYKQNAYSPPHEHQMNPCAPAKKASLPAWLWVLINHVVYGFVLGVFYRPHRTDEQ
ncbi:MAG: hypothetical protein KDK50_00700 [Chlamydiia bacterium]|nr:hypothetical protein [Chlamydiia bacterium]